MNADAMRNRVAVLTADQVVLMIKHPSLPVDSVTAELGIEPKYGWTAGEPRRTPGGTVRPGVQRHSYWAAVKTTDRADSFLVCAMEFVAILEKHVAFTRDVLNTGGTLSLTVQLSGRANSGDEIGAPDLARMAALGVNFGVEVFPDL